MHTGLGAADGFPCVIEYDVGSCSKYGGPVGCDKYCKTLGRPYVLGGSFTEEMHVVTEAVTCNPTALSSCLPAIQNPSQAPTSTCCNNLRDQKPCLCGYLRNPFLRGYVNSPGSKRVSAVCNVPTPSC
ncbi:Non-specific lipid-transfer protein 2 [Heracleum sosnowskyi]|uniref:Non-specific lipid-transfer protein 2 n=1 Tax=Heracleum sosnowskyi TaxID=360622 RepID=A0AAD8M7N8_9APIA|nr:Non-specific lipid-transfer protein 2 [Heracleum sosnowskyi]